MIKVMVAQLWANGIR